MNKKGKKLSSENYISLGLSGLLNNFGGMLGESEDKYNKRKIAHDETEDWEVDTCYTPDTNYWETGIIYKNINGGEWIIVEEYKNAKDSIKGHKKWVDFIKKGKFSKLYDIHEGKFK